MSTSIIFPRDKALAAGMEVSMELNGSPESIARYEDMPVDERDADHNNYVAWLKQKSEYVRIAGMVNWINNFSHSGEELSDQIEVSSRAHHDAIIQWLEFNQIPFGVV